MRCPVGSLHRMSVALRLALGRPSVARRPRVDVATREDGRCVARLVVAEATGASPEDAVRALLLAERDRLVSNTGHDADAIAAIDGALEAVGEDAP